MAYIITNKKDCDLAWSNSHGWCDEAFDTFTEEERETLNLPMDGEWTLVSLTCEN